MSALDMLDVAIGLVFLYLIMSLVSSAAVEFLEVLLQYRARDLERGICELLGNEAEAEKLYDHPLIKPLFDGAYRTNDTAKGFAKLAALFWKWRLPSYIPSRSFALALMDITNTIAGATPIPRTVPAPELAPPTGTSQAELAIAKLLSAAGSNAEKLRENVEEWFNASMDRVSGGYKRRTQMFLLVIGLVVAVWLDVDSIDIAKSLAKDKARRDMIVNQATAYAEAHGKVSRPGKNLTT